MKKSVVFLGFCLWGVHGANAESLDIFFQEQTPSQQPSSQDTASEDTPKNADKGATVIKPQVLYLEDLYTPEKPVTKPSETTYTPVAKVEKAKTPAAPEPQTPPVALPAGLVPAKPMAGAAYDAGKIKKEPLPKAIAQAPKAAPVPPAAATTPPAAPVVQKSFIQNRSARAEETQNNLPESSQTLSSFQEQRQGQYAPFATQTSRQQAAHSLVTQAKNEGRTYPAGLDPFVIEFDQTFAVLSPNRAIRDLYKTAPLSPSTVKDVPPLSFNTTPAPATPTTPVVTLAGPTPTKTLTVAEPKIEKTPETQTVTPPDTDTAQQQEQTLFPTEPTNTLVLDDTPAVQNPAPHDVSENTSALGSSPLATVMVSETAQALDPASQNLLNQVAAAYHDGTFSVVQITGYVNTRAAYGEDVRGYTHIQSLGRRGAAMVVDYLKGKNVPESAMAYRIIPTSTIALQNPFYDSVSTENTLRLDVAGGRS